MKHGEQCVMILGITMMPELCAGNWGTVGAEVHLFFFIASGNIATYQYSDKHRNNCILSNGYLLKCNWLGFV